MKDRNGVLLDIGVDQRTLMDGQEFKIGIWLWGSQTVSGEIADGRWFAGIPSASIEIVTNAMCGKDVAVAKPWFDGPRHLVCNQQRDHGGPCGWVR